MYHVSQNRKMKLVEKIINDKKGISLTELIVSVSIIAIISSITFVNLRHFGTSGDLNMTAQRIVSSVREVQSYALGLRKKQDGTTPSKGWGVNFDEGDAFYIVFWSSDDYGYDSGSTPPEEYSVINFSDNIEIKSVSIDGGNDGRANILYEPPDPTVYICKNPNPSCDEDDGARLDIVLQNTVNGEEVTIMMNDDGLVDVLN
jgi:prepilin-type N-terminal cleavage/methylation domain-containing protein